MILPIQTSYRGMERSAPIDQLVRQEVSALDRFYDRIIGCRTLIEQPHHRQGAPFHIRIELEIPGEELVVSHTPNPLDDEHKDVELAIREAFRKAARQLQDHTRQKSGVLKSHEAPLRGQVVRIGRDYGFLASADGTEIYFHRNSVLNGAFERLHVGSTVKYTEEEGEKGPQASSIIV